MAKSTVWSALKSAIPPQWIGRKNEVDLSIVLKGYDSTISLKSADNPDALRGSGIHLAILDECSNMAPRVWHEVIRPGLADTRGGAILQGTPRGYNWLHDAYVSALDAPDWQTFKFTTMEGGLVSPDEIELVRSSLDPITFGQEFEASFQQSTSRVYLMFDRIHNVRSDLVDPDATVEPLPSHAKNDPVARDYWQAQRVPLLVGVDFNVSPMSAVIAVKRGDELHVLDELSLYNSHTTEMAAVLKAKYPTRPIRAYPDPTGSARKTSAAGMTDHTLLRQAGLTVVAPRGSYAVADKTNTVNSLLCNVSGRRRLLIHPRCKRLIESLEKLSYHENTNMPDKSTGFDHLPDALAYLVCAEFPLLHGPSWAAIRGV